MALIKCKNCNSEVSDRAIKCPKCGTNLNENGKNKKSLYISIFVLVILILHSIFTICNMVEYAQTLINELYSQSYSQFIATFIKYIVYDILVILFLWFICAFWRYQKKAFYTISLILLILSIVCAIVPYFIADGVFNYKQILESLKYLFNQLWVNERELISLILLYFFAIRINKVYERE